MSDYQHVLDKVLEAANYGDDGPGPLSTGEKLMAALALNRPDWLGAMKYTIVEALERIGPEWRAALPAVARAASEQIQQRESARESADEALHIARFAATSARGREPIDCVARLVTSGSAPGYRDVNFTLELQPRSSKQSLLVALQVQPADGEAIARHIHEVHSFAWRRGTPLDAQPDEKRPRWVDAPF